MILTILFYFSVCGFLYIFVLPRHQNVEQLKKYSRSEMMRESHSMQVPSDWRSIDSIRSSLPSRLPSFKPQKPRQSKTILQQDINKENNPPSSDKNKSLSSFILKELESSMRELTKKPGHLNPYAEEFTSLNSF
jgi:hypothetical protein